MSSCQYKCCIWWFALAWVLRWDVMRWWYDWKLKRRGELRLWERGGFRCCTDLYWVLCFLICLDSYYSHGAWWLMWIRFDSWGDPLQFGLEKTNRISKNSYKYLMVDSWCTPLWDIPFLELCYAYGREQHASAFLSICPLHLCTEHIQARGKTEKGQDQCTLVGTPTGHVLRLLKCTEKKDNCW